MKIAIVILNWNGKTHLQKYLPFVVKYSVGEDVEIVVADNGSDDDSLAFLKSVYPRIRIIELDKNYGFAGGYNKALSLVEADLYCLLNSDVRVSRNWLKPVIQTFERNKEIAAIQPKILSDRDWSRFEHAGAAGGFIDRYAYPFCRGRIMNAIEYDKGQYNQPVDIFWASGACLFIRASVFHEQGGFDADFFAHMEEIDLCWRIKNQGLRVVYQPLSKVYHYGGATLEYNNPYKLFLNFRNSLWTLYKNYNGPALKWMMIKRMFIDTTAIFKFLISFNISSALAVIKAHVAYYRSKRQLRQKRSELQKMLVKTDHIEIFKKSIVVQFFLKSHKTYNDLKPFKKMVIKTSKHLHY